MPAKRVCPVPGCPALTEGGRCSEHRKAYEMQRGTPAQRGYDARHRREAVKAKAQAVRERQPCPMCGEPMIEAGLLDYDHEKPRSLEPESRANRVLCRRCNRSSGGRLAHGLDPKT